LYLENFNIPHTYVETGTSKITDQVVFSLNSISTPNTFFIFKSNISDHLDAIEATCGYPLIIKDTTGAGGKLSVLVKDRQELIAKSALLPKNKKFLYQKFIPNDFDWGILVANGEVVSAEKSYPKNGEFRNNSCNGATEEFVEIATVPEHIKTIAVQANNLLGLSWSRSDIIVDKNTGLAYLMEVNRCPGISIDTDEVSGARKFLWSQLTA
jgi:glutathione synthase/RimK-type ligase-like ATP-grasp enzyme